MNRLDNIISDVAYILDSLRLLRNIQSTGDCNECKAKRDCPFAPKPGQMVRYNCFAFVGELDGDPIDIDKAIEHYEGTLETLKDILEEKNEN